MLFIEPCPERDENWDQGHSLIDGSDGSDGIHSYKRCKFCRQVWRVSTDPVGHLIELTFAAPIPPDQSQQTK